jgi:serine/threonine protein phosphatase 1
MIVQPSIFVVGDIHGCVKSLKALLQEKTSNYDLYIFLGDYINKGPDSKGVIDFLMEWSLTHSCVFLIGNHEAHLLSAYYDKNNKTFYNIGGQVALKSFGVATITDLPIKYIEWMSQLLYYYQLDHYLFVHAGVDYNDPHYLDNKHFILNTRTTYFNYSIADLPTLIHGHTPKLKSQIINDLNQLSETKILGIDGGCVYHKNKFEKGYLIGFDISKKKLIFQENIDFN